LDIANIRLGLIVTRDSLTRGTCGANCGRAEENVADEITGPVKHDVNVTSMPVRGILMVILGIKNRNNSR
jgi:hypothetical protein